jgi:GT2 family glycosyltransferase
MDLSIVIVSWNTLEITRACLASVYDNCDDLEMEVFVVDNASEDGSQGMIREEFPQVKLIANDDNRGFAAGNNQAIRESTGRYILLLNSDTEVLGEVLPASVFYMDTHDRVGVMGCRVLNPDRTMQPTCFMYPSLLNIALLTAGVSGMKKPAFFGREKMRTWKRDCVRDVDVVTGCYMLVRRSAMDEVGLLDESFFFYGEETDWCRRFKRAGWVVRFVPVGEIIHIGNASARKYSHKRDVMLTSGLIRYHRKHNGVPGAAAAWALLFVFNVSRWIGWTLARPLLRSPTASERSVHFRRVVRSFRQVWPKRSPA